MQYLFCTAFAATQFCYSILCPASYEAEHWCYVRSYEAEHWRHVTSYEAEHSCHVTFYEAKPMYRQRAPNPNLTSFKKHTYMQQHRSLVILWLHTITQMLLHAIFPLFFFPFWFENLFYFSGTFCTFYRTTTHSTFKDTHREIQWPLSKCHTPPYKILYITTTFNAINFCGFWFLTFCCEKCL